MTTLRSASAYFAQIFLGDKWKLLEVPLSHHDHYSQKKSFIESNKSANDSRSFILIVKSSQVIVWSLKSSVIPSLLNTSQPKIMSYQCGPGVESTCRFHSIDLFSKNSFRMNVVLHFLDV